VRQCPQGQWCNPNDGQCEDDPCVTNMVECPNEGEVCRGGTCLDPDTLRPDAAGETHVTVGGGGGCSTTGGAAGLFVGLALLFARRRKRSRAAQVGGVQ
jgi:MYXO-CTERM domain-containing protein